MIFFLSARFSSTPLQVPSPWKILVNLSLLCSVVTSFMKLPPTSASLSFPSSSTLCVLVLCVPQGVALDSFLLFSICRAEALFYWCLHAQHTSRFWNIVTVLQWFARINEVPCFISIVLKVGLGTTCIRITWSAYWNMEIIGPTPDKPNQTL